jgi:type IV pilus assembly protein PilA
MINYLLKYFPDHAKQVFFSELTVCYKKAFTLMEIMVVIVIIGAITAIALPNYNKTIIHAQKQDAINNLKMIHAANQLFYSRTNNFFPTSSPADLTQINEGLNLDIIANDLTYNCTSTAGYTCTAIRATAPTFTVTLTEAQISSTNPACTGYCP